MLAGQSIVTYMYDILASKVALDSEIKKVSPNEGPNHDYLLRLGIAAYTSTLQVVIKVASMWTNSANCPGTIDINILCTYH